MKNRTLDELYTYRRTITARRTAAPCRRRWARLVRLQNTVSLRMIGALGLPWSVPC